MFFVNINAGPMGNDVGSIVYLKYYNNNGIIRCPDVHNITLYYYIVNTKIYN